MECSANSICPNDNDVRKWFFVSSPIPVTTIILTYLIVILKLGPDYMKNRKPYKLKEFILVYNMLQIIACIYIVSSILNFVSFTVFKFWQCRIYTHSDDKEQTELQITFFTLCLKIFELTETVVFVLRKKQNQVSFLHVFHHSFTIILAYLTLYHLRGGAGLFPIIVNTIVHIIMYSYYTVAAIASPDFVKTLTPIKKSITTIQMIQFCIILIQVAAHLCRCDVPLVLTGFYTLIVSIIFYLFYDFYNKSYKNKDLNNNSKKNDNINCKNDSNNIEFNNSKTENSVTKSNKHL